MTNTQTEKGFPGGSVVKNLPGNAEDKEMGVQSLAWEDPGDPLDPTGNPLWYSCLENSMDRGPWWAIIMGSK